MDSVEQFLNQVKDFSWKGIYIAISFYIVAKLRDAIGYLTKDYVKLKFKEEKESFKDEIKKECKDEIKKEIMEELKLKEENDK